MPIPLPSTDLSTLTVNQRGTLSLKNVGSGAGGVSSNPRYTKGQVSNYPTLYLFNESGSGLQFSFDNSSDGFILPAGAWVPFPISSGVSLVTFQVLYILPNAPVQTLFAVYYGPNEPLPSVVPNLGNSPIGVSGGVTVSSVSTLSNEGTGTSGAGNLVIDIGDATISQLITINTDGTAIFSVDQAGTAHQVIKINASGNPLQLGKAGDNTEVLGALVVDQTLSVTGASTFTGALTATASASSVISTSNKLNGGANLPSGRLGASADGDILDSNSATATYLKSRNSGGGIFFQVPNGTSMASVDGSGIELLAGTFSFLAGSMSRNNGSKANIGNGTVFSHGLGTTPFGIIMCDLIAQPGSATLGCSGYTSTQATATQGAGGSIQCVFMAWSG